MKTQILKAAIAIIIAINFNVNYVKSQTALSGTGSNTCTAGNAGTDNTFVGCAAGGAIQAGGNYNSALGENALNSITTGDDNVGVGFEAGEGNTTGSRNCYLGYRSGYGTTLGTDNTFTGYKSGYTNRLGINNSFYGDSAGYYSLDSDYNTYIGMLAGKGTSAYSADYNTFIGYRSGYKISTGTRNLFSGTYSGAENTTGLYNTFEGYNSGGKNTEGFYNTYIGYNAGYFNTGGDYNTCLGNQAGFDGTTGIYNTNLGNEAGSNLTTGSYNTICGAEAGGVLVEGSLNTVIGYNAEVGDYGNSTAIGYGAAATADNYIAVGNTSISSIKGQVAFTTYSDARIKTNIQENIPGIEFIKLLRPVSYHYDIDIENEFLGVDQSNTADSTGNIIDWPSKYDIEGIQFSGFIAQEVDAAATQIDYDFSGIDKPNDENGLLGLRYSEFVVPLVKAVQEQQSKIEELEAMIRQCCSIPTNKMEEDLDSEIQGNNSTTIELKHTDDIILYQNIPNPFGEETTINFYLPQTVKTAKMVFYDNMGKVITEVIITQRGNSSFIVKSSELSIGVYSYSLVADEKIAGTKMMVKER